MSTKNAELVLRLVDQVTAPARAAGAALNALNRTVSGIGASWTKNANGMLGLSAPVGLAGGALVRDVLDYEKAVVDLEAVVNFSDQQLAALEAQSTRWAAIGVGQTAYFQAATEFAKAGFGADQTIDSTAAGLALSKAGDVAADKAAGTITSTLSSFGVTKDFEAWSMTVADQVAFAADRSLASVDDLALSMTYAAPVAGALGLEIEELTAMQIALANSGIKGERAGTGLRALLLSIVDPSIEATKALKAMNVDLDQYVTTGQRVEAPALLQQLANKGWDATGTGINPALQSYFDNPQLRADPERLHAQVSALIAGAISAPMDDADRAAMDEAISKEIELLGSDIDVTGLFAKFGTIPGAEAYFGAIFGREATAAAISLSTANLKRGVNDVLTNSSGYAMQVAEKRTSGITGLLAQLEASVERFAVIMSDSGLLGDAMMGINGVIDGLTRLGELNPEMLRLGGAAAFALTGLAPLGWALSGMASTVAFLINPITLLGAALASLVYLNWDGISAFGSSFKDGFLANFDPAAVTPVAQAIDDLKTAFLGLGMGMDWSTIGASAGAGLAGIVNQLPGFVGQLTAMRGQLQPVFDWFVPVIESAARVLGELKNEFTLFTGATFDGITQGIANFQATLKPETIDTLVKWGSALREFATSSDAAWQANAQATSSGQASWWETELGKLGTDFAAGLNTTAREIEAIGAFFDQLPAKVTAALESVKSTIAGIDLYAAGVAMMQSLANGIASTAQMMVDAARGAVAGIPGAIMGALAPPSAAGVSPINPNNSTGPNVAPSGLPVPGLAKGGSYDPGLIVTGEKGAELQVASGRGQVFNAKDTRDMLSGKGQQGVTIHNTFQVMGSNANDLARDISRILDNQLQRSRGLSMEDRAVGEF